MMRTLMMVCAAVTCALAVFLIVYVLVKGSQPELAAADHQAQLSGGDHRHPAGHYHHRVHGADHAAVVLPLGVCAAVYLTEYAANKRVVAVVEYAAETLSGIPSIIYGLVGMMFFCQFLGMKKSMMAGALTLVIMNLPTIMRATQESLKTVPQSYREGALGLGAPGSGAPFARWCCPAVWTACSRAAFWPWAVSWARQRPCCIRPVFAHTLYNSLRATLEGSGATLSVALYVYAKEQGEFDVAFAIAAILMALALLINLAAMLTGRYFKKRRSL